MKRTFLGAAMLTALLGIHSATLRAADPSAKPAPAAAPEAVKAEAAKPAAPAEKPAPKKASKGKIVDIRGKVTAVNAIGMTITIEQKKKTQAYRMTSSTRLYVNDKPVMLKEITSGAKAAGTGKVFADGTADLLDLYVTVTVAKETAPEGEKKAEPAKKGEGKKAAAKKEEAKPAKAPAKKAAPVPAAANTNAAPALPAPITSIPPLPAQ